MQDVVVEMPCPSYWCEEGYVEIGEPPYIDWEICPDCRGEGTVPVVCCHCGTVLHASDPIETFKCAFCDRWDRGLCVLCGNNARADGQDECHACLKEMDRGEDVPT